VSRNAPQDEEIGQNVDNIDRLELRATWIAKHSRVNSSSTLSIRYLRQSWVRVLDEVVGPDMIAVLRPQADARSVGQPEPAALGLLMGNFQPLALPDTLDPLVIDFQPAWRSSSAALR
jgi:hypothetical protein